ncbi:MAG: DUF2382 domain-containing protein [Blastocatellia bacterium]
MKTIVIGLFDNGSPAQTVARELAKAGFGAGDIHLASSESEFKGAIAGAGMEPGETDYYIGEIKRGAAVVTVEASIDQAEQAVQIMRSHDARIAGLRAERELAFPVIEEELRIGKRMVEHGGVRIYGRITERPVEQEVHLREERINVKHRHADRIASEQDLGMFRDVLVEVTQMSEEPVVTKEMHVVDEVIISKEVVDHPQKIRETLRRADVEVEQLQETQLKKTATAKSGQTQAAQSAIPNDLRQLKDLKGFEIAGAKADPRGWDLMGGDGEKSGKIDSLLASPSARKAYFAVVDTGGGSQRKLLLVPLAAIRFDSSKKKASVPYLKTQFQGAPEYSESDRDYQRHHDYWIGLGGLAGAAGSGRR